MNCRPNSHSDTENLLCGIFFLAWFVPLLIHLGGVIWDVKTEAVDLASDKGQIVQEK